MTTFLQFTGYMSRLMMCPLLYALCAGHEIRRIFLDIIAQMYDIQYVV